MDGFATFRSKAPNVVHDIPDVLIAELSCLTFHFELGSDTVVNHRKYLAVRRAVLPLGIRQIWRLRRFRFERRDDSAIAFTHRSMANGAGLLKDHVAGLDRLGVRRRGVLYLLWVGVPTSLTEKADTKTQNKCGTEYQFFHGDSVNHNIFLLIDRLLPAF